MNIPDGADLLARCERLVERSLARGADEAEAYWQAGTSLDLDIESGRLGGSSLGGGQGGCVRVVVGGRLGFSYMTREEDAPDAIDRAIAQAKVGPGNGFALPAGGSVEPLCGRWDDRLAALDVDQAAELARDVISGATATCPDGEVTGGGVGIGWGIEAIVNSKGVAAWDRSTSIGAGASLVLKDGETAINSWDSRSAHVGELDGAAIGSSVGETVASLKGATPAAGGSNDVIFLPDAGTELVLGFVGGAMDGDSARRGRSVWSDSVGEAVAHKGLQLSDEPQRVDGIGTSAMDGEGAATRTAPLIADGRLQLHLFDSWNAHRHGAETTRHAVRGDFKALPGVGAHHVVLGHRETRSLDDLVAGVERGFLVESVLGAHTANATTGDFSVTAPNVWRIENGAISGASGEIALGGNLCEMLMKLDGVSDAPRHRDGAIVPALRFRDVSVSV